MPGCCPKEQRDIRLFWEMTPGTSSLLRSFSMAQWPDGWYTKFPRESEPSRWGFSRVDWVERRSCAVLSTMTVASWCFRTLSQHDTHRAVSSHSCIMCSSHWSTHGRKSAETSSPVRSHRNKFGTGVASGRRNRRTKTSPTVEVAMVRALNSHPTVRLGLSKTGARRLGDCHSRGSRLASCPPYFRSQEENW